MKHYRSTQLDGNSQSKRNVLVNHSGMDSVDEAYKRNIQENNGTYESRRQSGCGPDIAFSASQPAKSYGYGSQRDLQELDPELAPIQAARETLETSDQRLQTIKAENQFLQVTDPLPNFSRTEGKDFTPGGEIGRKRKGI